MRCIHQKQMIQQAAETVVNQKAMPSRLMELGQSFDRLSRRSCDDRGSGKPSSCRRASTDSTVRPSFSAATSGDAIRMTKSSRSVQPTFSVDLELMPADSAYFVPTVSRTPQTRSCRPGRYSVNDYVSAVNADPPFAHKPASWGMFLTYSSSWQVTITRQTLGCARPRTRETPT